MKIPSSGPQPGVPFAAGVSNEEKAAIKQVSKSFESLFVNQLVTEMRKTVVKQGLVPESHAEKVYQSLLDSEYSQKISETEQLGLSKLVYDHLLRNRLGQ